MQTTFDYIIIGAGSAGCVLANRLSADPERSVLLVEAGGADNAPELHAPEAWPLLMGSDYDWTYTSTPQRALGERPVALPRGRTLGGSSATNVMLYVRGDASDYDHWAATGNSGWSSDDLLQLFRRMETFEGAEAPERGQGGPLRISEPARLSDSTTRFLDTASRRGHTRNPDYNRGRLSGCAPYQSTISGGIRQSAARAFLHPVAGRTNLTVLTGCVVQQLQIESGRATGIVASWRGLEMRFSASQETILSAGAISTPKLLMLSGLGPAGDLLSHRIPVRADLPGVGLNLADHPLVSLGYAAECTPQPGHSGVEAVVFGRLDGQAGAAPDYQISFGTFLFFPPEMTGGASGCTLGVTLCQPESRGSVRRADSTPASAPRIDCGFLSAPRDIDRLAGAVAEAQAIAAEAGWQPLVTPKADTDAARRAFICATLGSSHHASGTCQMGTGSECVVGPDLRVHGIDGLRVADASVMPRIVSGNTNATAMVIGEKAADVILTAQSTTNTEIEILETTP